MNGPKLYGLAEFAAALGWDKRKLSTYMARGVIPAPHQQLASGPVWLKEQVEAYLRGERAGAITSQPERLLTAMRQDGHIVECPVTGFVIVDGIEVTPAEWDHLVAGYDGENLAVVLEQIQR